MVQHPKLIPVSFEREFYLLQLGLRIALYQPGGIFYFGMSDEYRKNDNFKHYQTSTISTYKINFDHRGDNLFDRN